MARGSPSCDNEPVRKTVIIALLGTPLVAEAGRHTVQRGETLEHVAKVYGCTTEAVLRANHLRTTLVRAGTVVVIPACNVGARTKTRARPAATTTEDDLDARAEKALAVIDGATVIEASRRPETEGDERSASVGQPWNGELRGGAPLPQGEGYRIRRPQRSFGASHVLAHVQRAIGEVRALYPDVHTLAIGDLSARDGGKLSAHQSHQSGLDIDVGFYFQSQPSGYPEAFVAANSDLDLEATWALVTAFARTAELANGVQMIFLDYAVQARLYKFAHERGTPEQDLAMILQYPRGRDELVGLVRHWPNHADHLHVRFKPGR